MATIDIGVDLGSRYMPVAARLVRNGESPDLNNISLVHTSGSSTCHDVEIPQRMFYHEEKLFFGKFSQEALNILEAHPHLQSQVMELPKLALHDFFKDWPEVVHVHKVLGTRENWGALQDLFANLFQRLAQEVIAYFRKETGDTSINFDNVQLNFRNSAPVIWGDKQLGIIYNAAKSVKPGTKVENIEEPLSAVTVAMEQLHTNLNIKEGQYALLLDIGGGTSDITMCMMTKEPVNNQMMELKRIGMSAGSPVGSHMLNNELLQYVTSGRCPEIPRFEEACENLHLTKARFMKLCSEGFDDLKEKFDRTKRAYTLTIDGNDSDDTEGERLKVPRIQITLERDLIVGWYTKWVDANEDLLREYIDDITKYAADNGFELDVPCAVFTGKETQCEILRSALERILREQWETIKFPNALSNTRVTCARGLLMHHVFQEDEMSPEGGYFYLGVEELYDDQLKAHEDVKHKHVKSKFDPSKAIVTDRARRIMHYKGDKWRPAPSGMAATEFRVRKHEQGGRLHLDLYASKRMLIQSSSLKNEHGNLKAGVRHMPLVFTDIGELEKKGFQLEPRRRHTGRPCGLGLQPAQGSPPAASTSEDDHTEGLNAGSGRLPAMITNADDGEDVEMREAGEDEDTVQGTDDDKDKGDGHVEAYYLVKGLVELTGTAEQVEVTLYLMKPHYKFRFEHTPEEQRRIRIPRTRAHLKDEDILSIHTWKPWEKGASHFVSQTTGASGPRGL